MTPDDVRYVEGIEERVTVRAYDVPGTEGDASDLVLVLDANSQEEADVARATLEAEGIPATLLNPNPSAGAGMMAEPVGATWSNGLFVPPAYAEAARAVLSAPAFTDAELDEAAASDPTTLAEAEARAKNA